MSCKTIKYIEGMETLTLSLKVNFEGLCSKCQTNNLENMLSKEVLMANKQLGGLSVNSSLVRDIMAVEEQLIIVPMGILGMEMTKNVIEVGEGSSNAAKMWKVRVPRRRGRKKLVK